MDMKTYTYFMRVAELRSFSRAADESGISQPTLSRHVAKLERELGVALFSRGSKSLSLTEYGERLYAETTAIVNQIDGLKQKIAPAPGIPRGQVSIAATPDISDVLLPPLLERYRRQYPHVTISIKQGFSGLLERALIKGEAELAVMPVIEPLDPTLVALPLCSQTAFLVGPGEHFCEMRAQYRFAELEGLPLVLPSRRHSLRITVERYAAECGFSPNVEVEVDGLTAIKALVRRGLGYSVLTHSGIAEELETGTLRASELIQPDIERQFVLATCRRPPLSVPAKLLLESIRDSVKELTLQGTWPNTRLLY